MRGVYHINFQRQAGPEPRNLKTLEFALTLCAIVRGRERASQSSERTKFDTLAKARHVKLYKLLCFRIVKGKY